MFIKTWLFFILFYTAICHSVEYSVQSDRGETLNWKASGEPRWVKSNGEYSLYIDTTIQWAEGISPSAVAITDAQYGTEVKATLKPQFVRALLVGNNQSMKLTLSNGSIMNLSLVMKPTQRLLNIGRDCPKLGIDAKVKGPPQGTQIAGIFCEIKDKKIVVTFSTQKGLDVKSTVFEVTGKGESRKTFEYKMFKNVISLKGKLGEIGWGNEKESSVLTLIATGGSSPDENKAQSAEQVDPHRNRQVGIAFQSLQIANENSTSTGMGIGLDGEWTGSFGKSRYGYLGQFSLLAYGLSTTARINYSNILLSPIVWFDFQKSAVGFFVGARALSMGSGQIGSGANAMAVAAGSTLDAVWFGDNKTHLRLSFSTVSESSTTGQEMELQLRQDFKFKEKVYSVGLNYLNMNLKTPPSTTLKTGLMSLMLGIVF